MPNWVLNRIEFIGDAKKITKVLEDIKKDKEGLGSVDFNKIIHMPDTLNVTSGSYSETAVNVYMSAINPDTEDFGVEKSVVASDYVKSWINSEGHRRNILYEKFKRTAIAVFYDNNTRFYHVVNIFVGIYYG